MAGWLDSFTRLLPRAVAGQLLEGALGCGIYYTYGRMSMCGLIIKCVPSGPRYVTANRATCHCHTYLVITVVSASELREQRSEISKV